MAAARVQGLGQRDALLHVPATLDPVGGGDADAQRHRLRHHRLDRVEHLQHQPHAVLQRPAIGIAAPVAQRRQEFVQQVAVRRMYFDEIQAESHRADRAVGEGLDDFGDAGIVEGFGHRVGFGIRKRGRRPRGPAARIVGRDRAATAFPGLERRGLAPGMGKLDAHLRRRPAPHRGQRVRERGLGGVVVQAQVGPADPPARLDRGGFDDHQPGAGQREVAPMLHMPVAGFTVNRRVLAHRRHHDAVGQRQRADGQRREELAHAGTPRRAATIRCRRRHDNAIRGTVTCRPA